MDVHRTTPSNNTEWTPEDNNSPHDAAGAPPGYMQEAIRAWKRRTETRLLHVMPILCAHQANQTAFAPIDRSLHLY